MRFKKQKSRALPYFFLGVLSATVLYLAYRMMTKKCRDAEKSVKECMMKDLFCDCEKDTDR